MKLTADRDGTVRFFSAKLGWGEHFDSREMEMLFAGAVPQLIAPAVVQGKRNNVLKYNVSEYSTMEFQISCAMSREQFADLLLQCIKIFQEMQRVYLNYKNLVFDLDKVYVQIQHRTVYFIYLPLMDSHREAALPDFFKQVLQKASRSTYEQVEFLNTCLAYLNRPIPFALEEFDAFIRNQIDTRTISSPTAPEAELVNAIAASAQSERVYRPISHPVEPQIMSASTPTQGATSYLDKVADGGTVLLCNPEPQEPIVRFYLIRIQTEEKIPITYSPFLLGTEAGSVSYCVIGNNAVSRRHAELSIKDGQCWITDQKSTNKTYVNDCALAPLAPQPLQEGDRIRLGNEPFIFSREE